MAIVTRRYAVIGPNAEMVVRYVGPGVVTKVSPLPPPVTFTFDDTTIDATTMDEYMATLGFAFSAGDTSIPEALPKQWAVIGIPAGIVGAVLPAQASIFNEVKAIRPGSIVGMSTRLTNAIVAGQLTIKTSINGISAGFGIDHTNVLNSQGGIAIQAPGLTPYVAGDLISLQLTTNALFAPLLNNVEASLQVHEA
jgi:hypothetical protein